MKKLILILLCLGLVGCSSFSRKPIEIFPLHSIIGSWESSFAVSGDSSWPVVEKDRMTFTFDLIGHFDATVDGKTIFDEPDKDGTQLYTVERDRITKLIVTSYVDGVSGEAMNAKIKFIDKNTIEVSKMKVRSGRRMVNLGTIQPHTKGVKFIFKKVSSDPVIVAQGNNLTPKLKLLKQSYEADLITKKEYETKKSALLDEL
ncbi:MAG: hypothetical protein JEZ12_16090 [Desulfobacterium sp.]|nr:hypothetical protein [Desulfobacterium sp.]